MKGTRLYLILLWALTTVCIIAGILMHVVGSFRLPFIDRSDLDNGAMHTADGTVMTDAFHSIRAEIAVSDVMIRIGSAYALSVTPKQAGRTRAVPTWGIDGDTLVVRQKIEGRRFGIFSLGGEADRFDIIVTVPASAKDMLSEIRIDSGTGRVFLDGIRAHTTRIDTGTGSVTGTACIFDEVRIDAGTGSVELALAEKAERVDIDAGTGAVDLTLPGSETDYAMDIDTGTGSLTVGDNKYRHEYRSHGENGDDHIVDIDGGTGKVTVSFE